MGLTQANLHFLQLCGVYWAEVVTHMVNVQGSVWRAMREIWQLSAFIAFPQVTLQSLLNIFHETAVCLRNDSLQSFALRQKKKTKTS